MFNALLGRKAKPTFDFPVYFHIESNGMPEHGSLYANNLQLNVKKERDPVRFSFGDFEPPVMTPDLLAYIWERAMAKGYEVAALRSYINIFTVMPAPRPSLSTPIPQRHNPPQRTMRRPSGARAEVQPDAKH